MLIDSIENIYGIHSSYRVILHSASRLTERLRLEKAKNERRYDEPKSGMEPRLRRSVFE